VGLVTNKAEFLKQARKRFRAAKTDEAKVREEARTDHRFVCGDQWEQDERDIREKNGRPCLTFNKLPSFVQTLTNEARQNAPAIKFSPVDDGADVETAEVMEGLARHIHYDSDADVAYETALECSASSSFGFVRLVTKYSSDQSFDLDLKIETVVDPFSVYGVLMPACRRQKCRFAFVIESLTHDDFEARYPGTDIARGGFETEETEWVSSDRIQVAEYWRIETHTVEIVQLEDGTVMEAGAVPQGAAVRRRRTVQQDKVFSSVICGVEEIEGTETEWPDSEIPIVAVLGKSMVAEGRVQINSLIRFARGPNKLINVTKTRIAETLAVAPISPWLAEEGQLEGHEDAWATAHIKPTPFLYYRAQNLDGQRTAPPRRQVDEAPILALSSFAAQENDDIKAATSTYDASLGLNPRAQTGIAIQRQQMQSSLSNLHFIDNLKRAHRSLGRMMARLIPFLYDTERQVRILGEDESERVVWVNKQYQDPESGKVVHYQISAGKYDVRIETGPSYTSKRQESFDLLTQMATAFPDLVKVAGDIIFRNSDAPGASEIADRLKVLLPAELRDKPEGMQQVPPQVQAQMAQMAQMIDQLTAALNESEETIKTKRTELQYKAQIDALKIEADLLKTNAQLASRENLEVLRHEMKLVSDRLFQTVEAFRADAGQEQQLMPMISDQELPPAAV
jgi:hypothetical protein